MTKKDLFDMNMKLAAERDEFQRALSICQEKLQQAEGLAIDMDGRVTELRMELQKSQDKLTKRLREMEDSRDRWKHFTLMLIDLVKDVKEGNPPHPAF